MFQMPYMKLFLIILIAASLGLFWYLDTKYYYWSQSFPEPEVENVSDVTKNETSKLKEFVPTHEWQIIENDQPIPPGLHVQVNIQTGVKKAKLIDSVEDKTNNLALVHYDKPEYIEDSKNVPDNVHKFKSIGQLQDDLKKLNLTIESDMEVMNKLSIKFNEQFKNFEESSNNIKNILTDLEYLIHQVDTAEVFVKNNGINTIIIPCINSNSSSIKEQGALLLGSAASNNQKVQIAALKADVIPLLLEHIDHEYEFLVQKNCLFALSSICRKFPMAQKEVIDHNGIQTFMSIFKRPKSDSNRILKLKISQLLEDLVIEIEDAKLTMIEEHNKQLSSEAKERVRQYNELDLKDKLVENEWCGILGNEFITLPLEETLLSKEEYYEMIEASGKSLLAMNKLCQAKLEGNKQLFDSLYKLESHYKHLSIQDDFFNPLYKLLNELTNMYDPVLE